MSSGAGALPLRGSDPSRASFLGVPAPPLPKQENTMSVESCRAQEAGCLDVLLAGAGVVYGLYRCFWHGEWVTEEDLPWVLACLLVIVTFRP